MQCWITKTTDLVEDDMQAENASRLYVTGRMALNELICWQQKNKAIDEHTHDSHLKTMTS